MSTETLLARLEGVKRTGPDRYLARCPCHDSKSGTSLSIRELDDGRILLHDFGGCSVEEVLGAVGLSFSDLFPERPIEHATAERRPFFPSDVFEIARFEITVAAIVAADMHKHKEVSDSDYQRLFLAVERLNSISIASYGR